LLLVDTSGKPSPQTISVLMLERASGNNKTLFDHTTTETSLRISPSEAAHVLITAQMFSLQGLNRKTTNLSSTSRVFGTARWWVAFSSFFPEDPYSKR